MDKKKDIKHPGQPKKPVIINEYPLKFRANYPDLKEKLKNMANKSGNNSLNDYLVDILNNHVKKYDPIIRSELESNFEELFQNIDLNIDFLESKYQTMKYTENQSIKNYISINFPNHFEKKIIYLKLIHNQIKAEKQFLEILLLVDNLSLNNDEIKVYNYIDYHIENNNIHDNINRNDIKSKFLQEFYYSWSLQLNLYHVFKNIDKYTIDINALEKFIFTELCRDFKLEAIFNKEKYNNLKEKWDEIIKQIPNIELLEHKPLSIENIEHFLILFRNTKKHFEVSYGLDTFNYNYLNPEDLNELKRLIDFNEYEKPIKLIEKLAELKQEFYKNKPTYFYPKNLDKTHLKHTKEDFISNLHLFYDMLMYGQVMEYKYVQFSLGKYFWSKIMKFNFKPYIIDKIIDLGAFYKYLRKKQGLENFIKVLWM